jgi:hypothetical protein
MGFDVSFTPPGDLDSSWSVFPARSECCPEGVAIKQAILALGSTYPFEYDPGDAAEVARLAAMESLFDATDPADLGEGYWIVVWNFAALTPGAEIHSVGGSGMPFGPDWYVGAQHFTGAATSPDLYIARAKMALKFGWQNGVNPPWRTIDGPTVTISYYVRTEPLDASGERTLGSTIGAEQTFDLAVAPDDTEAWSDWIDFAEPSGDEAVTIVEFDGDHPLRAYATQGCIGE